MLRVSPKALQQAKANKAYFPKQNFPVRQRIIDCRFDAQTALADAQISTSDRHSKSYIHTGATRQAAPSPYAQRKRPTHFLSLRLPQRNALSRAAKAFHEDVRFANTTYAPLLVPLEKLHVTLGVMTLPEEATECKVQTGSICEALKGMTDNTSKVELRFRGMGTFDHGRVLFSRVQPEAGFMKLERFVQESRRCLGNDLKIDMKGNPHDSYVPHVTLAKIRPHQQERFGRSIPMTVWASYQFADLGDVVFDTIDLCEMKTDAETKYYTVVQSFKLQ